MRKKKAIGIFLYGKGLGGNGRYVESLLERIDFAKADVVVFLHCPEGEDRAKFVAKSEGLGARIVSLGSDALPCGVAEPVSGSGKSAGGCQYSSESAGSDRGPQGGFVRQMRLCFYYLKLTWRMRRFFRSYNLDVLHLSMGTFPTLPHVLCGAAYSGISKVVMIVHIMEGIRNPRPIERVLTGLVVRSSFPIIALSETMKKELIEKFNIARPRIQVVYNGVDPEASRGGMPDSSYCADFRLSQKQRPVLVPARFHPVKGHAVLFSAITAARSALKDCVFLLAGEGPIEGELRSLAEALNIQDCVRFIGFRRDIPHLAAFCHFTVLPSFNEGFPFVLLEAMAAARPVLGTDVGAVCEMISDGENGVLVKPRSAESLADALKTLASLPPDEMKRMGEKGREMVLNHFTIDKMAALTFRVYGCEDLLKNKVSPNA